MNLQGKILLTEKLVKEGLNVKNTWTILDEVLQVSAYFAKEDLSSLCLYSEYLPKVEEIGCTEEQKYLHLLWEVLEKTPLAVVASFAIMFRRIIAEKLFKKCGRNFIAEENVRFNFGQNIEVGNDVFFNRGVFIDSKGGVKIGNAVALAEEVCIFTHGHSECKHKERSYMAVRIDDYAKIYSFATILPGVRVNKQGIVAAKSLVGKDVEENSLVAGIPAKFVRKRSNNDCNGEELEHVWLHEGAFQS